MVESIARDHCVDTGLAIVGLGVGVSNFETVNRARVRGRSTLLSAYFSGSTSA